MSNKTINQALKDLFLGLGGNPSALSDNTSVSDYIEDLEGAIKGETSSIIDDSAASESTTYSSSKVESLIPTDELPSVTSEDIGNILTVVSDGESGATWGKAAPSGGSEITYYEVTKTSNKYYLPEGITLEKIYNDLTSGKNIILKNDGNYYYPYYDGSKADDYFRFGCLSYTSGYLVYLALGGIKDSQGSELSYTSKVITTS